MNLKASLFLTVFSLAILIKSGPSSAQDYLNSRAVQTLNVQSVVVPSELTALTPYTNELLTSKLTVNIHSEPQLKKLSDLLDKLESDGLQKNWILSNTEAYNLIQLFKAEKFNQARSILKNKIIEALTALNRGFVTPDQLGEKTNVKPKKVPMDLLVSVENYLQSQISDENLISLYRPKNANYNKLLQFYRDFLNLRSSGQVLEVPKNLSTVKPEIKDPATILFARQRLSMFGYKNDTENPEYTEDLKLAIEDLQENNLLKRDGVIGRNSFRLLNTPFDVIMTRMKINLDRARWLPDDLKPEYVFINLAAQRLFYYKNNKITLNFRTINGRVERPTPIMFDQINHMRLNPTWTVPPTIYYKDKAPKFAADPSVAEKLHFKIIDDRTGVEVSATSVDWASQVSGQPRFYTMVQKPGAWNALGFIKFPLLLNSISIYMHDTNERQLFASSNRLKSSGCIRLEKPFELAAKLLNSEAGQYYENEEEKKAATELRELKIIADLKSKTEELYPPAEIETPIRLGRTIPVYILYETVQINDKGQMTLVPDPYGTDMDTFKLMQGQSL